MPITKAPHSGGNVSLDSSPPFLPLEENMRSRSSTETSFDFDDENNNANNNSNDTANEDKKKKKNTAKTLQKKAARMQSRIAKLNGKKLVMLIVAMFFLTVIYESFFVDPEERLLQPDFADKFLLWVQSHPGLGLGAISLVIAGAVVTLIPVGTPLVLGCGYIYRGVYGWKVGIVVATFVSMAGSCLGAVVCFLLGRYLMRETVQRWVRKYPLFDAIDVAASEQGLKIMAMLYLTPVLPLGLVSYMCGTTSMSLFAFTAAKIFSLPLYLIYTFMGASAHSFIKRGGKEVLGISAADEAKHLEENEFMILFGIILSLVMITLITRHIRKELMKILDQQKKEKPGSSKPGASQEVSQEEEDGPVSGDDADDTGVELGLKSRRRGHKAEPTD